MTLILVFLSLCISSSLNDEFPRSDVAVTAVTTLWRHSVTAEAFLTGWRRCSYVGRMGGGV